MKKTNKLTLLIATALLSVAVTPLHAAQINGSMTINGVVDLNSGSSGTATAVTAWHLNAAGGNPQVATVSGDFDTTINPGDSIFFAAPYPFTSGPIAGFWTVGGFTFNLTESHIFSQGGFPAGVVAQGSGTISGNGFDPTPGFWSFSTQDPSAQGVFSFSAAAFAVPQPGQGCTFTIGYWKNHAGQPKKNGSFDPDVVSLLLPIRLGTIGGPKTINVTTTTLAVFLLNKSGEASNGINKLYAQLLGAKLSIAAGADPSSITTFINTADTFLSTHDRTDWDALTKPVQQTVIAWADTFDRYNNGLIGPRHCE